MKKIRERWVVKAGSNVVCSGGPLLLRSWMSQVAQLRRRHGVEIVWVTSGAIASAQERTRARKSRRLVEKQALSAIGQPIVMDLYNLALQAEGLLGAQVLLTYDDLANAQRRRNFKATLEKLLDWRVLPILNENDAVATEEIQFGDNDALSAKVARVARADRLIMLTDVHGLHREDPRRNPRAAIVKEVPRVTAELLRRSAKFGGNARGTGGIHSKLRAAREANRDGIPVWVVKGDAPAVLLGIAGGKPVGTRIGS